MARPRYPGMDELERYLARRIRRQKFAITIRDPAEPAVWARLKFEDQPLAYVFVNGGIGLASRPDDPNQECGRISVSRCTETWTYAWRDRSPTPAWRTSRPVASPTSRTG